jgi:serine/threonine-protein kinase
MGVVYLAQDVALLRTVAIKVLSPDLARQAEVRARFLREARTVAALSHPNIVPIHAVEEHGELLFFVMGFVEGESLRERVERSGPLPPGEVTKIVRDIAWALGYAHGRGIVHRDVKPDNILLERASGRVLLTDFGIARRDNERTLSGAGELVGTLQYMSPEQASDAGVDGRSDLYSLGLTALFALTAEPPLKGNGAAALLAQVIQGPAIDVGRFAVQAPEGLRRVLAELVERDPQRRAASGEVVARALDAAAPAPIPAALRRTIDEIRSAGDATGFLSLGLLPALLGLFDTSPPAYLFLGLGAPLIGLLSGWYGMDRRFRLLVRDGFRFDDVAQAAEVAHAEYREVLFSDAQHSELEMQQTPRQALTQTIWAGATGVLALAVGTLVIGGIPAPETPAEHILRFIVTLGGLLPIDTLLPRATPWIGLATLVGGSAFIVRWGRNRMRRIREGLGTQEAERFAGFMAAIDPARILTSRLARALFASAERAQRKHELSAAPRPVPQGRSETIAIGQISEALAMLPPDLRARLGEVPELASSLDAKARQLRHRLAAAEAGLGSTPSSHPAHAQFLSLRDTLARRVGDVNAILEAIRLDLLRAAAGLANEVTISEEIQKAKELSAAIDAELHGQSEVNKLLG